MNAGKNYLDQGDATNALAIYKKAEAIVPNDADVRLNLANCYLLGGAAVEAIREADQVLKLEPNSAAAYFVKGSAYLRLSNPEEAAKALENAKKIDPGETATSFQLGMARMGLKQWDGAIAAFRKAITLNPNRAVGGELARALTPRRGLEDARAVWEKLCGRAIEDDCHARMLRGGEARKFIKQAAPRARLVPVPADALRHHIVTINEIRHSGGKG